MTLWTWPAWLPWGRRQPEPTPPAVATRPVEAVGRPTYAGQLFASTQLRSAESMTLLAQYYRSVPVLSRAIDILTGLVGTPELLSPDPVAEERLRAWSDEVRYGRIGVGLDRFLRDHLVQSLLYGVAVGELSASTRRDGVDTLWSYLTPACIIRSRPDGEIEVAQRVAPGREVVFPEETLLLTAPFAEACNPVGRSLFTAAMRAAQLWLDMQGAYSATCRRIGSAAFVVCYEPPSELDDPQGNLTEQINRSIAAQWAETMRSQVQQGQVKDFISTGKVTVTTIGSDGSALNLPEEKRAIVEEIVAATGVPPWMLGYSWSTTERLSTQQADLLLSTIESIRRAVTPVIHKIVDTHRLLAGIRGEWSLAWPEVTLQDMVQTATAEFTAARARAQVQQVARQLWQDGVYDQEQYALEVTGSEEVAEPLDAPPGPAPAPPPAASGQQSADEELLRRLRYERSLPPLRELLAEYAALPHRCNGKR
jgi:hypothetical protein